jgi:hypothetical protein
VKIIGKTAMLCKKNKNACGVIDTACTVIDTACTAHANYDTACTINERFEQPWQPLKVISTKNINVPEFPYPTTKTYKFKGAA